MEALLLALGKSIYYVRTGVTKRPYSIHPLFIFYYQLLTLKVGKQYQGGRVLPYDKDKNINVKK